MMETNTYTGAHVTPGQQPTFGDRMRRSKALLPTMAVLAVAVLALGATLLVKRTEAQGAGPQPLVGTAQPATAAPVVMAPATRPAYVAQPAPAAVQPAPAVAAYPPVVTAPNAPVVVAQAPCHTCGVVESVTPIQRQGQVQGIAGTNVGMGTVAGGVVGALLGNQIGHGSGRSAATVLGAVGGGYAGNAIEKNMKKVTVYQMRVRMNDGTYRTIEQGSAVSAGSHVYVEGHTLRLRNAVSSVDAAPVYRFG